MILSRAQVIADHRSVYLPVERGMMDTHDSKDVHGPLEPDYNSSFSSRFWRPTICKTVLVSVGLSYKTVLCTPKFSRFYCVPRFIERCCFAMLAKSYLTKVSLRSHSRGGGSDSFLLPVGLLLGRRFLFLRGSFLLGRRRLLFLRGGLLGGLRAPVTYMLSPDWGINL